jgi:DnaJ family protein C protein 28
MHARPQQPDHDDGKGRRGQGKGRNWSDLIEDLLEEARARGDFDNLPGKGQPLRLDDNPYAGDRALAYSLLENNNLAPPEIERGREIDAELLRAEELLAGLRRRRDALQPQSGTAHAEERRAYNVLREKTEARYEEALRAINSKILSLNIIAPTALHRRRVDVETKMRDFREEFPRMEE